MADRVLRAGVVELALGVFTKLLIVVFAVMGLLACLMLAVAGTLEGQLFAAAVLPLSALGVYLTSCLIRLERPRYVGVSMGSLAISAVCLIICAARAPSGVTPPDSPLQSVYLKDPRFNPLSPAILVPESDQIRLGSYVLPLIDPVMGFKQARRFRQVYAQIYAEIRRSPEYAEVGSVLGDAYSDMFLGRRRLEHTYIFYPSSASDGPRPAILFLHGWLGNFKAYVWTWSTFAEANGFVVVCPTFGGGYWDRAGAVDALRNVLDLCARDPAIDERVLYVAGLSNGGMGVTRAAIHFPDYVDGLIYISPVIEEELITSEAYVQNSAGKPILVVHGGADRRLPADYVARRVEILQRQGLDVQRRCYEEEDHLLILAAFDRLSADIADWMEEKPALP